MSWLESIRNSSNKIYITPDGKTFKLLSDFSKHIGADESNVRYHVNRHKDKNKYNIKIKYL